jgi:hypothetical protein
LALDVEFISRAFARIGLLIEKLLKLGLSYVAGSASIPLFAVNADFNQMAQDFHCIHQIDLQTQPDVCGHSWQVVSRGLSAFKLAHRFAKFRFS